MVDGQDNIGGECRERDEEGCCAGGKLKGGWTAEAMLICMECCWWFHRDCCEWMKS